MRAQTRSATFKKGESEDHFYAVAKVFDFLNQSLKKGYIVGIGAKVDYPPEIVTQLPKNRTHKGHTFDLVIYHEIVDMKYGLDANIPKWLPIAYIEINGNVGYDYLDGVGRVKHANPTKHSLKKQQQNDKINKNYCENLDIVYKVLLKEEINGHVPKGELYHADGEAERTKDMIIYLQRELLEFIKG